MYRIIPALALGLLLCSGLLQATATLESFKFTSTEQELHFKTLIQIFVENRIYKQIDISVAVAIDLRLALAARPLRRLHRRTGRRCRPKTSR